MSRSPSLFSRWPPSPRAPSVMSMPDGIIPVGWNWTNSMSLSAIPARNAMSRPSGVDECAYVEKLYSLPAPPVAMIIAFALIA